MEMISLLAHSPSPRCWVTEKRLVFLPGNKGGVGRTGKLSAVCVSILDMGRWAYLTGIAKKGELRSTHAWVFM